MIKLTAANRALRDVYLRIIANLLNFHTEFKKGYICYNGIINRPSRCFELKEKTK